MPLMYPIKHVFRNWKLFTALLIGIALAATFFAAIGVKANLAAEQAMDKQLSSVLTDMEFTAPLNQSNLALAYQNITHVDGVKKVDLVARLDSSPIRSSSDNFTNLWTPQIASFPNDSRIYEEWLNKPVDGIPENYTYLIAGTNLAKQVSIGDNITTLITFPTPKYYNISTVYVNLTIAGFAELTDNGYGFLSGYGDGIISSYTPNGVTIRGSTGIISSSGGYRSDTLIISWDNTFKKLWNTTLDSSTARITFSIGVDRKTLISPWNIQPSIDKINVIGDKIQNQIMASYFVQSSLANYLGNSLYGLQSSFSQTLVSFLVVSLPVFFVAWYLGATVSDVSFNIRRREIGLLSTKGLSSWQIQRMFLTEALVIGLVGGALGVVGGLILNQYYSGTVELNNLLNSQIYDPTIMAVTIIFAVVLALTSVFGSSRKAAKMPAVDTLRNYMPIDMNKPRQKILPLIALILGTYKIVVYILGINVQMALIQISSAGGFYLSIVQLPIILFDGALTYIGPLLFLWGLTKLLIRDSNKFQQLASKISSLMGDLGALAAKNVRRNPARLAAIAFLIALIMGYSVQVTGQIASQQDYTLRTVQNQVGADITVSVVNATKGQLILDDIIANVSGIRNASIERSLSPSLSSNTYGSTLSIRAIDPANWSASSYYEPEWYSGVSIQQALKDLQASNNTIILDRAYAKQLNLKLYDEVAINFNSYPRTLRIIGFFGPEPSSNSGQVINYPGSFSGSKPIMYYYSPYYSFVPNNLFNVSSPFSDAYKVENFGTTLRIKLDSGVNGTDVAKQIRTLEGNELYSVSSFDETWRNSQSGNDLTTYGSLQTLDIQGLGLVFAVLSASVGTALIAVVSLKERSREATLMSVRGLSYRQLVWMFLTESIAIITFAVILGVVVGLIIVYGNVTSANAYSNTALVTQRLIYPADALATIGTYITLIYGTTIGTIIVMTTQYVTKLEKMVRSR
jgi:ABC-type lipoprotein release transport system permease subunit